MIKSHDRFALIDSATPPAEDLGQAVAEGLGRKSRSLPCRFLYDEEGSRLFERICEVPEYYVPRAELEIFETHAAELLEICGTATIVELGSGNSAKTQLLLGGMCARGDRVRYVPMDICADVLEEAGRRLTGEFSNLEVLGVAAEYEAGLEMLADLGQGPKVILWLGGNVGNFTRSGAVEFLRGVRERLQPGNRLLNQPNISPSRYSLETSSGEPGPCPRTSSLTFCRFGPWVSKY